jgi:DNA-binding transcriptional MerR regulator
MKKLIKISELSKILELINTKNNKPLNHILRHWEKEFKQIKPSIINKRRYYTSNQVELIKLIKFLLKNKGMTIKGVKNILNSKINKLDDYDSDSLKKEYYKVNLVNKTNKVLTKIKNLKKYGKKNPPKSKISS